MENIKEIVVGKLKDRSFIRILDENNKLHVFEMKKAKKIKTLDDLKSLRDICEDLDIDYHE